ncbi:hypothetical protein Drorol1_Dr00011690 [Drosera rotundifolia]
MKNSNCSPSSPKPKFNKKNSKPGRQGRGATTGEASAGDRGVWRWDLDDDWYGGERAQRRMKRGDAQNGGENEVALL